MIAALTLGWVTALCWGISTLAAAPATRLAGPWAILVWANAIAAVVALLAAVPSGPPQLDGETLAYVAIGGAAFVGGMALFLVALNTGHVSLVTPIVACDGAIAALIAIAAGARVTLLAGVGLVTIVVGIAVVARAGATATTDAARFAPARVRPAPRSAALAVGGALLFGVTFFVTGKAGSAGVDVAWVVCLTRTVATFVALTIAIAARSTLRVPPVARPWLVACGIFDVIGFIAFVAGAERNLAVASVVASQYAAVAVLGAVAFGERPSRTQVGAVASLLAGTALLAAGGA